MGKITILKVGTVIHFKYGEVKVIEYIDSRHIKIRFEETGYETYATSASILLGRVKDPLATNKYGGTLGVGNYKPVTHQKEYQRWRALLVKCHVYATYSMTPEWYNFQVYAKWHEEHFSKGSSANSHYFCPENHKEK